MGFDVKGTTALVTGANRGIGRAITESLLNHGAARIYAAVRNPDSARPLVDSFGDRVETIAVDLGRPEQIEAAAARAGDVDLVINNAGVVRPVPLLGPDAIEALRFELETNVFGLLRIAQAFAPVLKRNGGGAFVQLNSVVSLKTFPDFATYAASKAASYAITQALHALLAEQGTAVLSVHPGPIATDMAASAGMLDNADPPSVVSEGIVAALKSGAYHLFPDTVAKQIGDAYRSFAENVIQTEMAEA